MTDPLVSIIVRTKDRPLLLTEALKSISGQTYRPLEICLVNDGGCECDVDVIKAGMGDVTLHYARHTISKGRAAALNTGIEHSKGTYVGILDDDDLYYPRAIKTLLDASREHENRPVYGKVVCRKEGAKESPEEQVPDVILGTPFCRGRLLFENFIPTNALLIPRVWVEKTGPFDNNFEIFEDWDWVIRLAEVCEPLFVASQVGEYRIFSNATIIGKGGEEMHRTFKEKILKKHLSKANAGNFLNHVQRMVDKVTLQKDAIAHDLKGRLEELTRQVEIKTEWVRERDERIRSLGETIHSLELMVHGLEQMVHDLEQSLHEREKQIRRIESFLPYKVWMSIIALLESVKKGLGRRKYG